MQNNTKYLGIKDKIENTCLHPLFNVATTIMGVFAGILGTQDEVLAPCFQISDNCEFSYAVFFFWVTLIGFAIFFGGTFWAQGRRSKSVAHLLDNIGDKTNHLDKLIRQLYTLPPEGFLFKHMQSISTANEAFFVLQETHNDPSLEEIAAATRIILTCIMELARGYDKDGLIAHYGCNLMLFIPSNDMSDEIEEEIEERLRFVDHGVSVRKLHGVLDLILPLSVASDNTNIQDSNLNALALPVPYFPATKENNEDKILLPGAPLAFVEQSVAAIESQEDWNNRVKPFSEKVRGELESFLVNQKKNIQSFISIPLYDEPSVNKDKEDKEPIGILNIHRNTPNDLLAEKLQLFSPLLVSYTILVGKLLKFYKEKRSC